MGDLQFGQIIGYWPDLVDGILVTIKLSAVSVSLGLVLGLALALARYSGIPWLNWPAYAFIEFFRTTPPLVQIIWLYYGLPALVGGDLNAFWSAAVALGLNIAAFFAEIFRAGIAGIDRTQWQAARVLGLNLGDTLRFVILPQALRNVLPPTGTTVIYLVKGTALATAIGTPELLRVGQLISLETFRPVETLTIVAIAYFVLTYPIALAFQALERRFAVSRT
ncbi:MAG: amino acid ABC transporter permease [Alphaproteobacteria bacterium]|nr:amino acid ABC transporter permease [Alphaproteobacteria bacterium]